MDPARSRRIWHLLEPVNAVAYFCPETTAGFRGLGFEGFWMGYFASRSAPMGRVDPGTVDATFFNFHPARVRRAIPEAWHRATPEEVLRARAAPCATSLRRLLSADVAQEVAARVNPVLRSVVDHGSAAGKPLFAGNREVEIDDDPVAALWQASTTLREHRGDCHVAVLTAAGLNGVEALVLFSLSESIDPELFMARRGWSPEEWREASDGLRRRGLVAGDGTLSSRGAELRGRVERRTDELAAHPYQHLSEVVLEEAMRHLERVAGAIYASGELGFPNPMGLPRPRS